MGEVGSSSTLGFILRGERGVAVWQGVSIHIHRQYLGRPRECITEVLEARLHHTHRPFDPLRLSDVFESTVCAR